MEEKENTLPKVSFPWSFQEEVIEGRKCFELRYFNSIARNWWDKPPTQEEVDEFIRTKKLL